MTCRAAVGTTWLLAGALALALYPVVAASRTPPVPQRQPAARRAGPPEYDLAVAGVDSKLRWQGGLADAAVFDVALISNGLRDVRQADVTCTVAGKIFRALNPGRPMKRGEPYRFAVHVSGREALDVTPGRLPAECRATIVLPRGARDGDPANDTAAGFVTVDPPPRPDLSIQSIALRGCDTRGPAVAASAVCAEVTYLSDNRGAAIVAPWVVACELAGTRASAPGLAPIDRGQLETTSVRFEAVPAGEHSAECSVDAGAAVEESNEENNRRGEQVLVLARADEARYDLVISGIAPSLTEVRDDATRQPVVVIEVRLSNAGSQPILAADVRCELGATGIVFTSSGGWSAEAGEERPVAVHTRGRRLAQMPSGTHEVTCAAGIVQPASVVETNVENNVATATVVIRR